jgi:hypothetical protein
MSVLAKGELPLVRMKSTRRRQGVVREEVADIAGIKQDVSTTTEDV